MPAAILPNPGVVWDVYMSGPFVGNAETTSNMTLDGYATPAYSPDKFALSTPRALQTLGIGGTGVTTVRQYHKGVLCWAKKTTSAPAIDALGGVNIMPTVDQSGLAVGYRNPSFRRVQWFTVALAMDSGGLDRNSGLAFLTAAAAAVQLWPIAPAVQCVECLGIFGDGTGNWNFESFGKSGVGVGGFDTPATTLESVSLASVIADPTDFHVFDFVFISATGSRAASLQLWIDGVLFLERAWGAAPLLEVYDPAVRRYYATWQVATTTGENHYLAWWEYKMGRFLPDGRELFE